MISPQLALQCHTQKKTAPCEMYRGSATADQNITFCSPDDSNSIYCYQLRDNKWNVLPSCPFASSGLVIIHGVLTAVGEWYGPRRITNKLCTLRQSKWVEEFPPMNTARYSPAVVRTVDGQHMNVVVIGGVGDGDRWINAVELYSTGSNTWSQITSLQQHFIYPSATICHRNLYVIGNEGNGYSCSLQALLSSDQPINPQPTTRSLMWSPLPNLPVQSSTAATLCGELVIIGGREDDLSPVNSIHQLVNGQLVKIWYMSNVKYLCLVASQPPDKMVVVVGGLSTGFYNPIEVCVAE